MSWDIDASAMWESFVSVLEDIFPRCEKKSIVISLKASHFSIVDKGDEIPPDLEKLGMDWAEKFPKKHTKLPFWMEVPSLKREFQSLKLSFCAACSSYF